MPLVSKCLWKSWYNFSHCLRTGDQSPLLRTAATKLTQFLIKLGSYTSSRVMETALLIAASWSLRIPGTGRGRVSWGLGGHILPGSTTFPAHSPAHKSVEISNELSREMEGVCKKRDQHLFHWLPFTQRLVDSLCVLQSRREGNWRDRREDRRRGRGHQGRSQHIQFGETRSSDFPRTQIISCDKACLKPSCSYLTKMAAMG